MKELINTFNTSIAANDLNSASTAWFSSCQLPQLFTPEYRAARMESYSQAISCGLRYDSLDPFEKIEWILLNNLHEGREFEEVPFFDFTGLYRHLAREERCFNNTTYNSTSGFHTYVASTLQNFLLKVFNYYSPLSERDADMPAEPSTIASSSVATQKQTKRVRVTRQDDERAFAEAAVYNRSVALNAGTRATTSASTGGVPPATPSTVRFASGVKQKSYTHSGAPGPATSVANPDESTGQSDLNDVGMVIEYAERVANRRAPDGFVDELLRVKKARARVPKSILKPRAHGDKSNGPVSKNNDTKSTPGIQIGEHFVNKCAKDGLEPGDEAVKLLKALTGNHGNSNKKFVKNLFSIDVGQRALALAFISDSSGSREARGYLTNVVYALAPTRSRPIAAHLLQPVAVRLAASLPARISARAVESAAGTYSPLFHRLFEAVQVIKADAPPELAEYSSWLYETFCGILDMRREDDLTTIVTPTALENFSQNYHVVFDESSLLLKRKYDHPARVVADIICGSQVCGVGGDKNSQLNGNNGEVTNSDDVHGRGVEGSAQFSSFSANVAEDDSETGVSIKYAVTAVESHPKGDKLPKVEVPLFSQKPENEFDLVELIPPGSKLNSVFYAKLGTSKGTSCFLVFRIRGARPVFMWVLCEEKYGFAYSFVRQAPPTDAVLRYYVDVSEDRRQQITREIVYRYRHNLHLPSDSTDPFEHPTSWFVHMSADRERQAADEAKRLKRAAYLQFESSHLGGAAVSASKRTETFSKSNVGGSSKTAETREEKFLRTRVPTPWMKKQFYHMKKEMGDEAAKKGINAALRTISEVRSTAGGRVSYPNAIVSTFRHKEFGEWSKTTNSFNYADSTRHQTNMFKLIANTRLNNTRMMLNGFVPVGKRAVGRFKTNAISGAFVMMLGNPSLDGGIPAVRFVVTPAGRQPSTKDSGVWSGRLIGGFPLGGCTFVLFSDMTLFEAKNGVKDYNVTIETDNPTTEFYVQYAPYVEYDLIDNGFAARVTSFLERAYHNLSARVGSERGSFLDDVVSSCGLRGVPVYTRLCNIALIVKNFGGYSDEDVLTKTTEYVPSGYILVRRDPLSAPPDGPVLSTKCLNIRELCFADSRLVRAFEMERDSLLALLPKFLSHFSDPVVRSQLNGVNGEHTNTDDVHYSLVDRQLLLSLMGHLKPEFCCLVLNFALGNVKHVVMQALAVDANVSCEESLVGEGRILLKGYLWCAMEMLEVYYRHRMGSLPVGLRVALVQKLVAHTLIILMRKFGGPRVAWLSHFTNNASNAVAPVSCAPMGFVYASMSLLALTVTQDKKFLRPLSSAIGAMLVSALVRSEGPDWSLRKVWALLLNPNVYPAAGEPRPVFAFSLFHLAAFFKPTVNGAPVQEKFVNHPTPVQLAKLGGTALGLGVVRGNTIPRTSLNPATLILNLDNVMVPVLIPTLKLIQPLVTTVQCLQREHTLPMTLTCAAISALVGWGLPVYCSVIVPLIPEAVERLAVTWYKLHYNWSRANKGLAIQHALLGTTVLGRIKSTAAIEAARCFLVSGGAETSEVLSALRQYIESRRAHAPLRNEIVRLGHELSASINRAHHTLMGRNFQGAMDRFEENYVTEDTYVQVDPYVILHGLAAQLTDRRVNITRVLFMRLFNTLLTTNGLTATNYPCLTSFVSRIYEALLKTGFERAAIELMQGVCGAPVPYNLVQGGTVSDTNGLLLHQKEVHLQTATFYSPDYTVTLWPDEVLLACLMPSGPMQGPKDVTSSHVDAYATRLSFENSSVIDADRRDGYVNRCSNFLKSTLFNGFHEITGGAHGIDTLCESDYHGRLESSTKNLEKIAGLCQSLHVGKTQNEFVVFIKNEHAKVKPDGSTGNVRFITTVNNRFLGDRSTKLYQGVSLLKYHLVNLLIKQFKLSLNPNGGPAYVGGLNALQVAGVLDEVPQTGVTVAIDGMSFEDNSAQQGMALNKTVNDLGLEAYAGLHDIDYVRDIANCSFAGNKITRLHDGMVERQDGNTISGDAGTSFATGAKMYAITKPASVLLEHRYNVRVHMVSAGDDVQMTLTGPSCFEAAEALPAVLDEVSGGSAFVTNDGISPTPLASTGLPFCRSVNRIQFDCNGSLVVKLVKTTPAFMKNLTLINFEKDKREREIVLSARAVALRDGAGGRPIIRHMADAFDFGAISHADYMRWYNSDSSNRYKFVDVVREGSWPFTGRTPDFTPEMLDQTCEELGLDPESVMVLDSLFKEFAKQCNVMLREFQTLPSLPKPQKIIPQEGVRVMEVKRVSVAQPFTAGDVPGVQQSFAAVDHAPPRWGLSEYLGNVVTGAGGFVSLFSSQAGLRKPPAEDSLLSEGAQLGWWPLTGRAGAHLLRLRRALNGWNGTHGGKDYVHAPRTRHLLFLLFIFVSISPTKPSQMFVQVPNHNCRNPAAQAQQATVFQTAEMIAPPSVAAGPAENLREAASCYEEKYGAPPNASALVSGEGIFDTAANKIAAVRPSEVWSYPTDPTIPPYKWWDITTSNAAGVIHSMSNVRVITGSTVPPPAPAVGSAVQVSFNGNATYVISYALRKAPPKAGFVAVGVDPRSDRGNFAIVTYDDPVADIRMSWGKRTITVTPRLQRCLTADADAWALFAARYGSLPIRRDFLSYWATDDFDSTRDDDAGGSIYAAFLLTACSNLEPDPHIIVTGACLDSYVTDYVDKKTEFVRNSTAEVEGVISPEGKNLLVCDFAPPTASMSPRTLLHILERNYKSLARLVPVSYRISYAAKRRPVGNFVLEQMQKSNEETKEQIAITFDRDADASRVVGSGTLLTQKSGNFFYAMNSVTNPTITGLFVDVRYTHVNAGLTADTAKGKMSTAMCIYARKDTRYYPYTDVANNIVNGVMMTQNYPPEVTNIIMAHGTFNLGTVATQLLAVQSGYATTLYYNGFQLSTAALLSLPAPRHSLKDTVDFAMTPLGHYKPANRLMLANSTNFPWPVTGGTEVTNWPDAAVDVDYPPTVARFSGVVTSTPVNYVAINASNGWSLTNATYGGLLRFSITGSYMYPVGSAAAGTDQIAIAFALKAATQNLDAAGALVTSWKEEVQTIQTKCQGPGVSIGFSANLTLPVSSCIDSVNVQAWIVGNTVNISTGYFIHQTAWEFTVETPDVTPRLVPGLVSLQPAQTVANINVNALLSVPATLSESLKITPQLTSYPVQLARGAIEQGLFSYMSGVGLVNMSKVLKTDLSENAVMPLDMLPYPQIETEGRLVPEAPMRTAILPILGSLASTFLPVLGNKLAELVGGGNSSKPAESETSNAGSQRVDKRLDNLERMLGLFLEKMDRRPLDTATKPRTADSADVRAPRVSKRSAPNQEKKKTVPFSQTKT